MSLYVVDLILHILMISYCRSENVCLSGNDMIDLQREASYKATVVK